MMSKSFRDEINKKIVTWIMGILCIVLTFQNVPGQSWKFSFLRPIFAEALWRKKKHCIYQPHTFELKSIHIHPCWVLAKFYILQVLSNLLQLFIELVSGGQCFTLPCLLKVQCSLQVSNTQLKIKMIHSMQILYSLDQKQGYYNTEKVV